MAPNHSSSTPEHESLELDVRDALDRNTALRMWKNSVDVRADVGTIVLSGHVRSRTEKEAAETLARSVKGVVDVDNQLVIDGDLEQEIAGALAADPRTQTGFPGILVGVVFGVVYLKGAVASDDMRKAAGEIAGKIVGIQRISNELRSIPAKAAA